MRILLLIFLIIISSCRISKTVKSNKIIKELIKGRWELLQPKSNFDAFSGSNNIYIFEDTTFKNISYWFSDVEAIDTCTERARYNYSKGIFLIKDSVLYLEGNYTNKNFEQVNTNSCAMVGSYKTEVDIIKLNDTLVLEFMIKPKYNLKQQVKFIKK